jgi:hypothetical protein
MFFLLFRWVMVVIDLGDIGTFLYVSMSIYFRVFTLRIYRLNARER